MCGRMTLFRRRYDELADELDAFCDDESAALSRPRFNVAPTDPHPVVRLLGGQRRLHVARWGWPGGPGRPLVINVRAETAAGRPDTRLAFARRRCVVPADGFFEWSGVKESRRPFWLHRPDDRLLLFAGLYDDEPPDGPAPLGAGALRFTVLTTAPNALVAKLHDRMPVVLTAEEASAWLRDGPRELLDPAPDDTLVATPVSRRVNSVKNDDPGLLTPEPDGQLPLF